MNLVWVERLCPTRLLESRVGTLIEGAMEFLSLGLASIRDNAFRFSTSRSVLWRVVVLFAFVPLVCCADPEDHKGHAVIEKGACVRFRLGDTQFNVARRYLKGASETSGGVSESAFLWALLPDFEGYDKTQNRHEFTEVLGWGRRIYIDLYVRSRSMTVPQIVARDQRDPLNRKLGLAGKPYGSVYGLEYYRTRSKVFPAIYIYRREGMPVLKFRCDEDFQVRVPGCQVNWDYNSDVAVMFSFKKTYLPQWREILRGVKGILNGDLGSCVPRTQPGSESH